MTKNNHSPIKIVDAGVVHSQRLHWQRRLFQTAFIVLLLVIPMSGLLRIDPAVGAFVVLDRQIWWADFYIVFGFWMALAALLVVAYSIFGMAFCGWACPQNSWSELADYLTRRMLGKRAVVQLDASSAQLSRGKAKTVNWVVLGVLILIIAMFFAIIPLFYFYHPEVVWSFVTMRHDERLAPSIHYIYSIFVLLLFVNIGFIRHFMCRFMCVYKIWQHGFKTRDTLHIDYDSHRVAECDRCNYCKTACFIDLDPRNTDLYDSCINCGECITACNNLQAKKQQPGLLRFSFANTVRHGASPLGSLSSRGRWSVLFVLLGSIMFAWGMWNYEPHRFSVYRADTSHGVQISDYQIAVFNKKYQAAYLRIKVVGLDETQYELEKKELSFTSVGKLSVNLAIKPGLAKGLYSIVVQLESDSGWQESFQLRHFQG